MKLDFKELKQALLDYKAKSEYKQAAIIMLRNIFKEAETKQYAIHSVVFNEAENCTKCLKPKRTKPNTIQVLCECDNSEVELICAIGKENCPYTHKDILTCKYMRKCNNCGN